MRSVEKSLLLQILDQVWKDHLLSLDHLRQGIGLRAYAQKDPLNEYKRESFGLFEEMLASLRGRVTSVLGHVELELAPAEGMLFERPDQEMLESRDDPAFREARADSVPPRAATVRVRRAAATIDPTDPSTWGRVSRHGLVAHASSLDTIGVICASVEDAALVLERIAGPDGLDSTARSDVPSPGQRPVETVGVLRPDPETMSPEVIENLHQVRHALSAAGIRVTEVRLPALASALAAYLVIAAAEAASNLARYDGSIYGARTEAPTYAGSVVETRTRGFGTEVKLRILLGTELLRQGHATDAPRRARQVVTRLDRECASVFAEHDTLLMPTVPDVAFGLGTRLADPLAMRAADRFTVGPSLLGLPAVAVPSGENVDGAPLSMQCIAPRGRDERALALAGLVEEAMDSRRLRERSWWPRIREPGS